MQAMPTISQLVEIVADAARVDLETMRQIARFAREAGYLPTSRGKAIAKVGHREAAVLLGALLAGDKVVKAGEAAASATTLLANQLWLGGVAEQHQVQMPSQDLLWGLGADHTFVDMIEIVLRALAADGRVGDCPILIRSAEALVRQEVSHAEVRLIIQDTRHSCDEECTEKITYTLAADRIKHLGDVPKNAQGMMQAINHLTQMLNLIGRNPKIHDGSFIATREIGSGTFHRLVAALKATG